MSTHFVRFLLQGDEKIDHSRLHCGADEVPVVLHCLQFVSLVGSRSSPSSRERSAFTADNTKRPSQRHGMVIDSWHSMQHNDGSTDLRQSEFRTFRLHWYPTSRGKNQAETSQPLCSLLSDRQDAGTGPRCPSGEPIQSSSKVLYRHGTCANELT